jgi:POLQ-like helicase
MKPEAQSRRLLGITRSKGKMYEFGLPPEMHLAIPSGVKPQHLFPLAVGTLGDVAAAIADSSSVHTLPIEDVQFAASFFDAFVEARFYTDVTKELRLLGAAAYYLANRPGSSNVLARDLRPDDLDGTLGRLLLWVLQGRWAARIVGDESIALERLESIALSLKAHFDSGADPAPLFALVESAREAAYRVGSSRDLLHVDLIAALVRRRIEVSTWTMLPRLTGIDIERWRPVIQRPEFPKELWPAQVRLGEAGLFAGASGIVQMPTSAGKTRSVEFLLRSAFLSGRTRLAVVVAPFRALCHEIGMSLRVGFRGENVRVNELSDTLQLDFLEQIAGLFGTGDHLPSYVMVLTPEKLLYVLRQRPELVAQVGVVVYDEGHQFDSGARGITYELLLAEIKALLPSVAQTVLVSAVMQNASAIGSWLIGENARIVDGATLHPTARSYAFASWTRRLGQLMFFESLHFEEPDYFVPRVVERHTLQLRGRERSPRDFPDRKRPTDVGIYLGLRLVSQGAVAVFCGRRDTATSLGARVVEAFARGLSIEQPALVSDPSELARMRKLFTDHFGPDNMLTKAASLGVFVHHGATPHGVRLSIEYGMQSSLLRFVICTSTLAQGVNLPIRYLIVSGVYQGRERLKVRDFQNLIGRAGRSGFHTEGLVIFSDPSIFDRRGKRVDSWKFATAVELLSPHLAENVTSSLLGLIAPLRPKEAKRPISLQVGALIDLLLSHSTWIAWAESLIQRRSAYGYTRAAILDELAGRRRLLGALESHMMANRGEGSFEEFLSRVTALATATLAYHLAPAPRKDDVVLLFQRLAQYVNSIEPEPVRQASYAKTLLGTEAARDIEQWVNEQRLELLALTTNAEWLDATWPLFLRHADPLLERLEPSGFGREIAGRWLQGVSYGELFRLSEAQGGRKPWGTQQRALTEADIVSLCDHVLGYECSLVLAAIAQFLNAAEVEGTEAQYSQSLLLYQKALKYGLPDSLTTSCYEFGLADREVAKHVCSTVQELGFTDSLFSEAFRQNRRAVEEALVSYPSYFRTVLESHS